MADMVLVVVLRKLGDIAGNLIVKEGSRLSRVKEDLLWIIREMRHIRSYLEDVDAKQWGNKPLTELLRDIWDLAYDVEDIIDTYFPKLVSRERNDRRGRLGWLKTAKWILLNCKTARDFAVEIEGIKKRVEEIDRVRRTYEIKERTGINEGDTWDPRRSFPHIDEVNVVGFDKHVEELAAKVLDEDLRHGVVSITGMAGLGKTTLAKKVYNSVKEKFECVAWIYASQRPNIKELLRDIAGQVKLEEEKRKQNLEANLFELLSQKRYVIVIDDIWDIEPWNALKNGIPINSEKGSRIIITSRYKVVGDNIGLQVEQVGGQSFLRELRPLDETHSRKLFYKMITSAPQNNGESSDPSQLDHIGEQILKKCSGVPLAIVVTAGLLSQKRRTISAWEGVLEKMGQCEDKFSEIFALSYKDLPIRLKPCFLYFGLFPEDREIFTFDLINIWAAEGFIQGSEMREVEDVGNDYLDQLIGRNLIQVVKTSFNGRVASCRIHDILHDLCIRVANEINFLNSHNDISTPNSAENVRRVNIYGRKFDDYVSLNCPPKLRVMMCDNQDINLRRLGNFFGDDRFLRVLSLSGTYLTFPGPRSCQPIYLTVLRTIYKLHSLSFNVNFYSPKSVPNEVGNLSHLTYLRLGFRRGFVKLPYTIRNLRNLQTLHVRECQGVILPNVIWNMKQLRHILLPKTIETYSRSFCGVTNSDPIQVSLPNLQTLYGLPGPDLFEADWLQNFTKLRTLTVNHVTRRIVEVLSNAATPVSHMLEELWLGLKYTRYVESGKLITLNLSGYAKLCSLRLGVSIKELPQHDKLPPNLTNLILEYTYLEKDPMENLKTLSKLKILELGVDSYSGTKMVCSGEPGSFPQLEVLKIERLRGLKELIVLEGGMPKLETFTINWWNLAMKIPDRIRNVMMSHE